MEKGHLRHLSRISRGTYLLKTVWTQTIGWHISQLVPWSRDLENTLLASSFSVSKGFENLEHPCNCFQSNALVFCFRRNTWILPTPTVRSSQSQASYLVEGVRIVWHITRTVWHRKLGLSGVTVVEFDCPRFHCFELFVWNSFFFQSFNSSLNVHQFYSILSPNLLHSHRHLVSERYSQLSKLRRSFHLPHTSISDLNPETVIQDSC